MNKRNLISSLLMFLTPIVIFGQSISGTVSSEDKPLVGANIVVEGSQLGTVSGVDGAFSVAVPAGEHSVIASFIGYSPVTQVVVVDSSDVVVDFTLVIDAIAMSALEVLASRADETTPVAYTNVSKEEMEVRLGSQDIPMILNTTPSVLSLIHI